tara:strand:- start:1387 stop:1989 length:603 start_codon:yes stop_codon:yes gene_type:complete
MSKAILIGNGPSALENEMGEVIDSFDYVLRFNRWNYKENGETHGDFSKYTGNKCTHWIVCDVHFYDSQLAIKFGHLYDNVVVYIPKFKWGAYERTIPHIMEKHKNVQFLHPSFEDSINEIVNFSPKWPTTGVVGIHYALSEFDEVFMYGFDTYNTKYDKIHYFEDRANKYKFSKNKDHSPTLEKDYIEYMQKNYNLKTLI